uniref:Uncharacterized protein n=1 Tax=Graphocephala atropunctata TaxID=36148 RepID=A0A1B6L4L2_9HEMI
MVQDQGKRIRTKTNVKHSDKRKVNQFLRRKGKAYIGYKRSREGKVSYVAKGERKMGQTCTSNSCARSRLRSCDIITKDQRQELFTDYWENLNWNEKKEYVVNMVIKTSVNRRISGKGELSRRSGTLKYHFVIDGYKVQVCKKMFLNTLGIKDATVTYWLSKYGSGQQGDCV